MKNDLKILITGDFYSSNRINQLIQHRQFEELYNDFLSYIKNSNIAITNLESPLTEVQNPTPKTGPAIKASPITLQAIKYAGFNLLTLANNHIMDYGVDGLVDTLKLCDNLNVEYCGVGMNLKSASKVLYKQVENVSVAFINITENEFSTTQGEEPGANPLNLIGNFHSILEAKKNAELVFLIVHGGHEMYPLPSPRMKKTYRYFVELGVDVVVGHHPHCYSGYEHYKGGFIFYSLGNFLFDKPELRNSPWNYGFALQFTIKENNLSYEIIPYEQSNLSPGVRILNQEASAAFHKRIERLNEIISDDQLLRHEFDKFCKQSFPSYEAFLEPYSNKLGQYLKSRGFIPSLLGKKKRLLYLNLIRCESHRELLIQLLQK